MVQINRTGLTGKENYFLGRGCFLASEVDDNGTPIAWRDLGNADSFSITGDTSNLEHFSNCFRNRVKDLDLVVTTSFDFEIVLEEWHLENMGFFFQGTVSVFNTNFTAAAPSAAGIFAFPNTTAISTLSNNQADGRYYDVYLDTDTAGGRIVIGAENVTGLDWKDRVYDLDPAQLTLTVNGNTYTANVGANGFTYNPEAGHIFVAGTPRGQAPVGLAADMIAASAGSPDNVVQAVAAYGAAIPTQAIDQLQAGTSTSITLSLKAVLLNGNSTTEAVEMWIPSVRLRPSGDINLLSGDELGQIPLSGSLEVSTAHDSTGAGLATFRTVTI